MKHPAARICLLLIIMFIGGALAPPVAMAKDHLLFAATMYSTQGYVYQLDGEGNLRLRAAPQVPYDCEVIKASPDGHTVVYSGFTTPTLTVFHIGQDGALSPPVAVNGRAEDGVFYPVAFHPTLPWFYVLSQWVGSTYRYDWSAGTVEPTGEHKNICDVFNVGMDYSAYSNRLIFPESIISHLNALGSVPLLEDGTLGDPGPECKLPLYDGDSANYGFAVSPDGRWVAASGLYGLYVTRVGPDGVMTPSAPFAYGHGNGISRGQSICFSPDSRFFYMLNGDRYVLVCFEINQETGQPVVHQVLDRYQYSTIDTLECNLTITADGRYAVFRTVHPTRWREDYNMLHVVRLTEDGGMEYLDGKQVDVPNYVTALAFAPLPENAAGAAWALYE